MKRNFLKSTGAAALLTAFLLLPTGAHARDHGNVWLRIMAFTDAPVIGADVGVSVHGRPLVEATAATNNQGVFPARILRPWLLDEEAAASKKAPEPDRRRRQSLVRISISGGTINGDPFLGHLSADIAVTDPEHQILVVNPVTTLVSRLLDERPELKLDEAEAAVRSFLKLPENYSLGLALRQSSHYVSPFFSPVVFLKEAQAAGGLDAFLHLLLQELASPSAGHPFRPPQLLGSRGSSDTTHAQLLGSTVSTDNVTLSSNALSVMKTGLYAGLLDVASAEGVGNLAGWALSYTSLATPGAVNEDIAALQQSLDDLQSSIDNLSTQVSQLTQLVQAIAVQNTQTQYITITTAAQTLANQVNDEENRLMYLAQDCPPLPDGSTPPPLDPTSFCATEPQAILTALSDQPIYSSYTNVESYVQDNGTLGVEGMIHLYSLWLSQSRRFFRPADSTKMQNLYDYWDGVLTQAADLKVELLHGQKEQDAGGATLMGFMGNPDATPPTTGTFQLNENENLALMFPPVPLETVVDTKTRLMWMMINLPPPGTAPDDTQYECQDDGVTGPSGIRTPPSIGFGPPNLNYYSWNGFTDWSTPGIQDLQTLVDGGGNNPMGWLIDQTKAVAPDSPQSPGFPNIVLAGTTAPTDFVCSGQTAVWSRDPAPNPAMPYYVFNFSNGATELPQYNDYTQYQYWVFYRRPVDEKSLEQYYFYQ